MRAQHRFLKLSPALAAAVIIATLIAPTASAAQARLRFGTDWDGMRIGSNCVRGMGAVPDSTVRLVWKSASGALKVRTEIAASPGSGYWSYCSDTAAIAIGDVLKVSDELGSRSFTMPNVTLVADRVHDNFRGKGPANSTGELCYHAGLFADYYACVEITSDDSGSWFVRPEELGDLIGGIDADVTVQSAKGDWMSAHTTAAWIEVTLGRSRFAGGTTPFRTNKASVRDADTDIIMGRGTAVSDDYGSFSGEFLDADGNQVKVAAGDRIRSNIASDADWIVPNIEGTADVATDFVNGRCFDTGVSADEAWVTVYRVGGGFRGFSFAYVQEDGSFEIDFSQPDAFMFDHANIKHGDRVSIRCLQTTGDVVHLLFRVP